MRFSLEGWSQSRYILVFWWLLAHVCSAAKGRARHVTFSLLGILAMPIARGLRGRTPKKPAPIKSVTFFGDLKGYLRKSVQLGRVELGRVDLGRKEATPGVKAKARTVQFLTEIQPLELWLAIGIEDNAKGSVELANPTDSLTNKTSKSHGLRTYYYVCSRLPRVAF